MLRTVDILGMDGYERKLAKLSKGLQDDILTKTALAVGFTVEGTAKQEIQILDAIDTAFMLNSVFVTSKQGSSYAAAQSAAMARADRPMLPENQPSEPGVAIVAVGAEYGPHVHYGTVKMAARPFMTNAVDNHMPEIERAASTTLGAEIGRVLR